MTIYEIDKRIRELLDSGVDEETGEILFDSEALEKLQMDREEKVENLALAYKNQMAEVKAFKEEIKRMSARCKVAENNANRTKSYLDYVLGGQKFKSVKVSVSYRTSESLELDDEFTSWASENNRDLLRFSDPEPEKNAIKEKLKNGEDVPFARLVTNVSIQVR